MRKFLLILCLFVFITSCNDTSDTKPTIVAGISADYPPFDMIIDGKVSGFDAELAHVIAEELGYHLIIKEIDFAGLIPAIEGDIIDFAISNISKTEEREKRIDFSIPYYQTQATLLFHVENQADSLKDFKEKYPDKSIAIQTGSVFEEKFKELGYSYISISRIPVMIEELKAGRIAAIILDEPQAKDFTQINKKFQFITIPELNDSGISIAFKKHSPLTEAFNQAILKLKENGKMQALQQKWLVEYTDLQNDRNTLFNIKYKYFILIGEGVKLTLLFSFLSTIGGMSIGLILTIISNTSKILRWFTELYISILRGTPLILQLSIIYFAIPGLLGIKISIFASGIIAFSINSSAYIIEHLKSGINAVDKGQIEAAKSMGMSNILIFRLIIIPQAFRNIFPSIINEAINLVKESSIISIIGGQDIMRKAQLISAESYDLLLPLMIAGLYYYLIINLLNILLKYLNRKLAY